MRPRRTVLFLFGATVALNTALFAEATVTTAPEAVKRPNIIFILADDLGVGNVSCYGADNFRTPNIDALAMNGLRLDSCYASPLCGPSRALVMTGRYAFHTGMTGNAAGPTLKPSNEVMMPTMLRTAGYVSGMVGKWAQLPLQPSDWGFDEYLRFAASGKYWNFQKGGESYTLNGRKVPLKDGEYLPDRMHEFAVDFIRRHRDQPFYLYYAMSHVHNQIPHAEDQNHESVYMLKTPDSDPGTTNQFVLFRDNVSYMDKLVGKLVRELDDLHLRENTLIIFAGDNGTADPFYTQSTVGGKDLSGHKGTMLEGGALVPCIVNCPGRIAPGRQEKGMVNICDFFPTLAHIAGAELPKNVVIDGTDFAPQLLGQSEQWPRPWAFVQLGRHWYDREAGWKLNEANALFDMSDAPFVEKPVPAESTDPAAVDARKRLQGVLDQLSPATGIVDTGDGSGKFSKKGKKAADSGAQGLPANSGNQNAPEE